MLDEIAMGEEIRRLLLIEARLARRRRRDLSAKRAGKRKDCRNSHALKV